MRLKKIKGLWKRLSDRQYRAAYLDSSINSSLAAQIYSLRKARGLTQSQMADLANIRQPTLSKYESDCDGITTTSLKKIAAALDVALIIKFAPYSEFAREIAETSLDRHVPSFDADTIEHKTINVPLALSINPVKGLAPTTTSRSRQTALPVVSTSGRSAGMESIRA